MSSAVRCNIRVAKLPQRLCIIKHNSADLQIGAAQHLSQAVQLHDKSQIGWCFGVNCFGSLHAPLALLRGTLVAKCHLLARSARAAAVSASPRCLV